MKPGQYVRASMLLSKEMDGGAQEKQWPLGGPHGQVAWRRDGVW